MIQGAGEAGTGDSTTGAPVSAASSPALELPFDEEGHDETENGSLRDLLCAECAQSGPIPFRRFMETVLYHPRDGYYASARERIGRSGDYLTSPAISPLFGYALARQLAEFWRCLDRPSRFTIVEAGAGAGTLARDILRWSAARDADFFEALRYTTVERGAAQREAQGDMLERWLSSGKAAIGSELSQLEPLDGCIVSNELLDSMPVHRVRVEAGALEEIYVNCEGRRLYEFAAEPSTPALRAYFERLGLMPGEDCIAEVNLDAPAWMRAAAGVLRRGYILTLDYGYPAARLYAPWRKTGTLLSFHRHSAGENPYVRLGRQDLTAHVDFTTLIITGEEAGLRQIGFTDQGHFLARLGLGEAVRLTSGSDQSLEQFYARRRAAAELLNPDGLGRIRVLLLARDAPDCRLIGFAHSEASAQ